MSEEIRIRKPDYDLEAYLRNNREIFDLEDIHNIHAEVAGHNDEDHWFWIIELKDGRFLLTEAWCDFTGWDCDSGGVSMIASSALEAAEMAPEYRRPVRRNLIAQVKGEQPFGLEVRGW